MITVFADSFYFIAQLNPADEAHGKATAFTRSFEGRFVTTDWVLAEVGDAFSRPPNRERFVRFFEQLPGMPDFSIVPVSLADGFRLFADRPDKEWSLTDCLSFVLMTNLKISEALTRASPATLKCAYCLCARQEGKLKTSFIFCNLQTSAFHHPACWSA